jgi:hypothetical protein
MVMNTFEKGLSKMATFILVLLIVETWSHPWIKDEISIYVFRNMIVFEEFCNFHQNINLCISVVTCFLGIDRMLKHGIQFEMITKTWFFVGEIWNFRSFEDEKKT